MKKFLLICLVCLSSQFALAEALDTPQKANSVKNKLENTVLNISGVNGIGITGCDPKTGKKSDLSGDFVHCVVIFTENEEAYRFVQNLYPEPTRIQNVFVVVELTGEVVPEPRLTVGN